jgi:hypothetical protein
LLYDAERALAQQSYQHWLSNELFSLGWFVIVGVLFVFYITWWILVDKKRISQLLLIGSFAAVWYVVMDMIFGGLLGVAEYKIRLFPIMPAIFIVSVTLAPVMIMLIQQYTSSWKGYLLWCCLGTAVMSFALLPLYTLIGIFALHGINYFHIFLILFSGVLTSRFGYMCVMGIQRRHSELKHSQ